MIFSIKLDLFFDFLIRKINNMLFNLIIFSAPFLFLFSVNVNNLENDNLKMAIIDSKIVLKLKTYIITGFV